MVRLTLPFHLQNLARCDAEVQLEVADPVTVEAILDALEARYPMLKGTVRDHVTKKRRAFLRFFCCGEDISMDPTDRPLPQDIVDGTQPFMIVGAIAGG